MNLAQWTGQQVTQLLASSPQRSARYTLDDYMGWITQFTYDGLTYQAFSNTTLNQGQPEEVDRAFQAYVDAAYKANGIIFACTLLRMQVFSQARFMFQQIRQGRTGKLFGTDALTLLENPWLHGTTATLLSQAEVDVTLAGNFYGLKVAGELIRLRPDWVSIVLAPRFMPGRENQVGWKRVGYVYREGGYTSDADDEVLILPDEMVHYAPYPDPAANFRGMSWITPVVREMLADKAATKHKHMFFVNGATPNLMVRTDPTVIDTLQKFRDFVEEMDKTHRGVENAYKTLYLAGAADAQVIGSDMRQIEFTATQGKGETRMAAAAGTHPVLVGLSEGMQGSALNAGNYSQVRRRFVDTTLWHLWTAFCGAATTVVPPPPNSRLWFDVYGIPFLRDDAKDEAEIMQTKSATMRNWLDSGWTPESVQKAMLAEDISLLEHSGLFSVQLQPPGTQAPESEPEPVAIGAGDTGDEE